MGSKVGRNRLSRMVGKLVGVSDFFFFFDLVDDDDDVGGESSRYLRSE